MKILFVTPALPVPARRGFQARALHQIQLLSARHAVTLLSLDSSVQHRVDRVGREFRELAPLDQACERILRVPWSLASAARGVARSLLEGTALQIGLFAQPALQRTFQELLDRGGFDLVHIQLSRLAGLLAPRPRVPVVLDLVDSLAANMAARQRFDRGPMLAAARLDGRRLARQEYELTQIADRVLVVTDADRVAVGDGGNVLVNPCGVDLATFPSHSSGFASRPPDTLVFTGNLGYFANIEAAQWFTAQVLPEIWSVNPHVTLTLAGARPSRVVKRLAARDPRIRLLADVPSIPEVLAAHRVAIAPMREGSGQLLKVLEAMASRTPLVATRAASRGLSVEPGCHLLVADPPSEFAAATLELLRNPELATTIADAAYTRVKEHYTWQSSIAQLEAIYGELSPSEKLSKTSSAPR